MAIQEPTRDDLQHRNGKADGQRMSGAHILCESLVRRASTVFGLPGGAYAPVQRPAGFPRCATSWSATSRPPRTWPTATPAPRATSGVCMATSGPGATNLVTGI